MQAVVKELLELMQLEQLELNLFRGCSRDLGTSRVFGGQVLGQALLAANQTVEGRVAHSLHAYFLRAGDPEAAIIYDVDRSRDGRSFSSRRVVAIQHGRPIFNLAASFQTPETGLEHQLEMPPTPHPDEVDTGQVPTADMLERIPVKFRRWFTQQGPFEFRVVERLDPTQPIPSPPLKRVWFRCIDRLPNDPVLHQCLLAYASDFHLIGTATLPHGVSFLQGDLQMASLDHAMWFHHPVRVDEWLMYHCDSPSASGTRGLARGSLYSASGQLLASTAQEGLIRLRQKTTGTD